MLQSSHSTSPSDSDSQSAASKSRQSQQQAGYRQEIKGASVSLSSGNTNKQVDSHKRVISRSTDKTGSEPDPFTPTGTIGISSPVIFQKSNIGRRRANAISLLSSPARRGHSEEMARLFQQARETVKFQDQARKRSCDERSNKENKEPKIPAFQPFPRLEDDIPAGWRLQHVTGKTDSSKNNNHRSGLSRNVELPLPTAINGDEETDVGCWTGDEDFLPKNFPGLTPIRPLFSGSGSLAVVEDWLREVDLNLTPPSQPQRHQAQDSPTRQGKSDAFEPAPLQIKSRSEGNQVDVLAPPIGQTQSDKQKLSIRRQIQRRKANRTTSGRIIVRSDQQCCPANDSRYFSSSSEGSSKADQSHAENSDKADFSTQPAIFTRMTVFSKAKRPLRNGGICTINHDKPLPPPPLQIGRQSSAKKGLERLLRSEEEPIRWKSAPTRLTVKRLRPSAVPKTAATLRQTAHWEPGRKQLKPVVTLPPPRLPEIKIPAALSLDVSALQATRNGE